MCIFFVYDMLINIFYGDGGDIDLDYLMCLCDIY